MKKNWAYFFYNKSNSYTLDHNFANATDDPSKIVKNQKRNKSYYGADFVAPDGGWGWLVAIASGINMLVTFAVAQNFGIIYNDYMIELGITSSQITTMVNIEVATSTLSGLLNAPMFRRYTFRQVSLVGSLLTFLGILLCVFADSFLSFFMAFSVLYGLGRGLVISASSMAINTYFQERRRTATAYQFTVGALGPIGFSYLCTYLMGEYGVQGCVLIFCGISLNNFASALIFQPVRWHVKKTKNKNESEITEKPMEKQTEVYTIETDEKKFPYTATESSSIPVLDIKNNVFLHINDTSDKNCLAYINGSAHKNGSIDKGYHCALQLPQKLDPLELRQFEHKFSEKLVEKPGKNLTVFQKTVEFFDLELLRDLTYVNLSIGLALVFFFEASFAILLPFVLADFGFKNDQIAPALSLHGAMDLVTRFLIPLVTSRMKFTNKTYFLLGVVGMIFGRALLSASRNLNVMLASCCWMGISRAFRYVFWYLVMPDYIELNRLPAAMGLQFLITSIFSTVLGPLIGLFANMVAMMDFINGVSLLMVMSWVLEDLWHKYQRRQKKVASIDTK